MLLLSVDTSGKYGSIALARCDSGDCDVVEVVALQGGTFSAQLVPQIAALLAKHGFAKHDIAAFAVATGPGSFTGLRVGLAAIKALAEVLQRPIASVSLLEALASAGSASGRVLSLMDAGRGEVFAGSYEIESAGNVSTVREELLRLDNLGPQEKVQIVTADPSLVQFLAVKELNAELVERPRADAIARLGWRKIRTGNTVSPEHLEANYIRQSDAEIFSKPQR